MIHLHDAALLKLSLPLALKMVPSAGARPYLRGYKIYAERKVRKTIKKAVAPQRGTTAFRIGQV